MRNHNTKTGAKLDRAAIRIVWVQHRQIIRALWTHHTVLCLGPYNLRIVTNILKSQIGRVKPHP